MRSLEHSNILALKEVHETTDTIFMVYESGESFHIIDFKDGPIRDERKLKTIMKQMLSAIEYLRRKGILLNRLYLDNLLIHERERGDFQVKLYELNTVPMDPEDEADCEDTLLAGTVFYQM